MIGISVMKELNARQYSKASLKGQNILKRPEIKSNRNRLPLPYTDNFKQRKIKQVIPCEQIRDSIVKMG